MKDRLTFPGNRYGLPEQEQEVLLLARVRPAKRAVGQLGPTCWKSRRVRNTGRVSDSMSAQKWNSSARLKEEAICKQQGNETNI